MMTRIPLIGDTAPDFKAKTTEGWVTLSEYCKDSWVILFSHPADFTPVCSTEMSGFAKRKDEFTALNTKLLGLSIDSVFSHIGWVESLKHTMGQQINFPIIADINMAVAKLYGMIHPGEVSVATVRTVFFIDPKQKVRLIMYYPLNVGRNMDEILRCLKALQLTDQGPIATPLDWQPGCDVLQHAPEDMEGVAALYAQKKEKTKDWYITFTESKK